VNCLSGVGLSRSPEGPQRLRQRATTRWPKSRCFEAARQTSPTHEMAVGHLDAPSVTDGTKDFGPCSLRGARPIHSANFVVEFVRESLGRRLRSAPVNEHELQSFVRARAGEVVEYLFDALASEVAAGTTRTQSGRPVTSTQTIRLAPLVRP